MYEEDRQAALAMYVKMFEDAEDEQALIQALISPTRQAVIVARAYNAKERKLQVEAQTREETGDQDESEGMPDFMLAIHQVYQDSVPLGEGTPGPLADQFSLFEEGPQAEEAEETAALTEETLEDAAEAVVDAAEAEAAEASASEAEPAAEAESLPAIPSAPVAPVQENAPEEAAQDASAPEAVIETVQEDAPESIAAAAAVPLAAAAFAAGFTDEAEPLPEPLPEDPAHSAEEAPAEPEQSGAADEVEQFLADFSITDPTLVPLTAERETPVTASNPFDMSGFSTAPAAAGAGLAGLASILNPSLAYDTAPGGYADAGAAPDFPAMEPSAAEAAQEEAQDAAESPEPEERAEESLPGGRKARPLLLILFILAAIPVTLLGIALLLIPTLFFLALGIGVISAGIALLVSAFSGFAVFADIMLLLGAALIVLALGLLCLWTFVWFLGGGIVGLIRSVISLGSRWCYKEVSA